jgi:hypothetical protein
MRNRLVLVFLFVKVDVRVRHAIVIVLVNVNFAALARGSPKRADTQPDDHQRDRKLHPIAHKFRNRDPQRQHYRSDDEQRDRMTHAPKRAHDCRTENIPVPTHNRRNRNDMIDFSSVF